MNEIKDKDLQTSDIEEVKKAIENTRQAAMKIGQSMSQSGASSSSESSSENTENTENKEEEKKN